MTDPTSSDVSQEDKTMALLAYILAIPTGIIVPLVLFILKKDQSKFVAYHSLQALLFEIAVCIIAIVSFPTAIGPPIIGLLNAVALIIAALAANKGEWYSFPVVGDFTRKQLGMS